MQHAGYHTWYVGKWHSLGRPSDWGYEECQALFGYGNRSWPNDIQVDWKGRKITGAPGCVFQTDDGRLLREKGVGSKPNISAVFADAAIDFIKRKPQKPFFLQVNFLAPHDPLLLPPGYEGRYRPEKIPVPPNFLPEAPFDTGYLRTRDELLFSWPRTREAVRDELAMYYLVISYLDAQIGRILATLEATGQAAGTIVIYTSDQGIAIGSHGLRGKQNMYEHTIGVPLIFAGPGIPKGSRCDAQCYIRDLYPTACELAGMEAPETVQGTSLAPLLRGETTSDYPCTFAAFGRTQRMIRTDRWKLIHYPKIEKFQLFDLSTDPHELNNLASDTRQAAVVADLRAKLEAWHRESATR
jgi:arylsulfatase A-like enzyme